MLSFQQQKKNSRGVKVYFLCDNVVLLENEAERKN
jgi:hypothetical protein